MGCTVSLVCCEALEPAPLGGPQPPGTPPGPERPERCEPRGAARTQRRQLLLQVELGNSLRYAYDSGGLRQEDFSSTALTAFSTVDGILTTFGKGQLSYVIIIIITIVIIDIE
ncbi:hypothetical protein STEG23_027350 [Scotinomys teguina]